MRVWTNLETDWTLPTRLAGLGFAVQRPSLQLRAFVHSLWCAEVPVERQAIHEFLHPDGGLGLNFSFGSPMIIAGHTYGPGVFFERTVVRSTPVTLLGGSRLLGVRFNPGATARFFNEPLRVLNGLRPTEGELAGELRELHRQLQHASAPFALLEDWLRYRLRPAQNHCELVEHALDDINLNSRSSAPREVAKIVGVSPRTLQRAFAQLVGVPLQQYFALRARRKITWCTEGADARRQ